jgi:uncharacterized membrane protein
MGIFATILNFIPGIVSLVQSVETLFVKGTDKKQAVVNSADGILAVLKSAGLVTDTIAAKFPAAVSDLVDAIVTFLNAIGVFQTSSTTASK